MTNAEGVPPSTKTLIKAIWRIDAKNREAVARNTQRYANEQENTNDKTY